MAYDSFVKIDGIPGESTDDKHKDWIEILSFHHGITQPAHATASSAGGATAERVDHEDFRISKHMDKSSPMLYQYCCTGKHIRNVVVEMCRAGGDKMRYMEVKMEDVLISGVRPGGAAQDAAGFPSEEVSFNYGKIKWTYTQQKRADGSGGGNTTGGWDLTANKVYA
jgi:type VI secretion system secreted protein Hcp